MMRAGRRPPRAVDEELLAIAAKRFARDGFAATTMRDIADDLGVAVATSYHHFVNKADILVAVVEGGYEEVNYRLTQVAAATPVPAQRFEALVRELVATMTASFDFATAARFDRGPILETMGDRYRALREEATSLMESAIDEAVADGTLRADVDHHLAVRVISGSWNWIPDWFVPANDDGDRLAEAIGRIACRGVLAPAGSGAAPERAPSSRPPPRRRKSAGDVPLRSEPVVASDRRTARMAAIVDAAATGFAEIGYDAASVVDLCRWTGIARGALYRYIGSKQELLISVMDTYLEDLSRRVADIEYGEPVATLEAWATAVLSAQYDRPHHAHVVMNERRALPAGVRDRVAVQLGSVDAVPRAIVPRLVGLGERPEDATNVFVGMIHASYLWYRPDGLPPADLARLTTDLFLRGMTGLPVPRRARPPARGRRRDHGVHRDGVS